VANIAKWDGRQWHAVGAGLNNQINDLIVFDDGSGPSLFAGGIFTASGQIPISRVAKWNGATWQQVGAGFNSAVAEFTVFEDASGAALYAGGFFTSSPGSPANYIAKWTGSSWAGLSSQLNSAAWTIYAVNEGPLKGLYAGGQFSSPGGRVARWNGSAWTAMGPSFNNTVYTIRSFDDGNGPAIFVGGVFTPSSGQPGSYLAKWNGASGWLSVGGGTNGSVWSLESYDDGTGSKLLAAGTFTVAGSEPASRVAAWDGSNWSSLGGGTSGWVLSLKSGDFGNGPTLFAGGSFVQADGVSVYNVSAWQQNEWGPLGRGLDGEVRRLQLFDAGSGTRLYAAGSMTVADGESIGGLARWSGESWEPVQGPFATPGESASALEVLDAGTGAELYAALNFTPSAPSGENRGFIPPTCRIDKWDGATWTTIGDTFNSEVLSIAVFDDGLGPAIYAGGYFQSVGGVPAPYIAKWNGSNWLVVGSGFNDYVSDLIVFDDGSGSALYAAGAFTHSSDGQPLRGLARWNGSTWTPVGSSITGPVYALAEFDDGIANRLCAAGLFAFGTQAWHVAAWNGTSWQPIGPGFSDALTSLIAAPASAASDPILCAGGHFQSIGGAPAKFIASWNGAAWLPLGSGLDKSVEALALGTNSTGVRALYVGGDFGTAGGFSSGRVAKWACMSPEVPQLTDLAIASASLLSSTPIVAGQPVQARVLVINSHSEPYEGVLSLSIVASIDHTPSPDDHLLASTVTAPLALSPGGSTAHDINGAAPLNLSSGMRFLLATAQGVGTDQDSSNNSLQFAAAALQSLTPAQGQTAFVLRPGESAVIPVDVDSPVGVTAQLESDLIIGSIDLFADRSPFVSTTTFAHSTLPAAGANSTLAIPTETSHSEWFLLARARQTNPGPATCILRVEPSALEIDRLDRIALFAATPVSIDVHGRGFPDDVEFSLHSDNEDEAPIPALDSGRANSIQATPQFDLSSAFAGTYRLFISSDSTGVEAAYVQPLTISPVPGSPLGGLRARLTAPEFVQVRRDYALSLSYENAGGADLPAPVFRVRGTNGFFREVVARGRSGQIDVMLPGESGPGNSASQRQNNEGSVTYAVSKVDYGGQEFDWDAVKSSTPEYISAADWNSAVDLSATLIGNMWDDVFSEVRRVDRSGTRTAEYLRYVVEMSGFSPPGVPDAPAQAGPSLPLERTDPGFVRELVPAPPGSATVIVTHGWAGPTGVSNGSGYRTIETMANATAEAYRNRIPPVRVLAVDWDSRGLRPGGVSGRIPDTARQVYNDYLRTAGINPASTTFVGHSFGNLLNSELIGLMERDTGARAQRQIALNPPNELGGAIYNPAADFSINLRTDSYADDYNPSPNQNQRNSRDLYLERPPCFTPACDHSSGPEALERWLQSPNTDIRQRAIDLLTGRRQDIEQMYRDPNGWHGRLREDGSIVQSFNPFQTDIAIQLPTIAEQPIGSTTTSAVGSIDPNDITGPAGFGPERWVTPDAECLYTIRFENLEDATAPAQEVLITQALSSGLDPLTVEFIAFGLGELVFELPTIAAVWQQRLDLRSALGINADVTFDTNPDTGEIRCFFQALDPLTNVLPIDPRIGLIPPNTDPPAGEGWVAYRVRPRAGLQTGATIDAQARIVFDLNDPIDTPVWTNTVDADAPVTSLGALPAASAAPVALRWEQVGQDEGAPLTAVHIEVSVNGGPFELWRVLGPNEPEAVYHGSAFKSYRFVSYGVDGAGNYEGEKSESSVAATKVYDFLADGVLNAQDYFAWLNAYNAGDTSADVNGDGALSIADATEFYAVVFGGH